MPTKRSVSRSVIVAVAGLAPLLTAGSCGGDPQAVTFTQQPADVVVSEGGSATFTVAFTSTYSDTRITWGRAEAGDDTFVPIPGADAEQLVITSVGMDSDGARFRATATPYGLNPQVGGGMQPIVSAAVTSDVATLTVVPSDACLVPPRDVAFDTSTPPPTAGPEAAYDVNLLVDASFEASVRVGLAPSGFGYWRFDESVSAPAQQGIEPRSGSRMLHFVGSSRDVTQFGTASAAEQVQLVGLSALADDVAADRVRVTAAAHFARVVGCDDTDDAFSVIVAAFAGAPEDFAAKWTAGVTAAAAQGVSRDAADMDGVDGWLLHRTSGFRHDRASDRDGDVFGWRRAEVAADVPVGTDYLAIILVALENVVNDTTFPEFHGHYADDAELVLSIRP